MYSNNSTYITPLYCGNTRVKKKKKAVVKCTHVNDHADSGESSSQILWVGRPHSHRDDPRVETAIEGGYQVDTCRRRRREPG